MQNVFVWGDNRNLQLGLPASITSLDSPQPIECIAGTSVQKILCGRHYTAVRTEESHELYTFAHGTNIDR